MTNKSTCQACCTGPKTGERSWRRGLDLVTNKIATATGDNHLSACKESPQQRSVGGKVDTIWVWVGDRETVIQQDHLQVSQVPAQRGPGVLGLGSVGISLVSLHKVSWVAHLSTGGNPHSEEPDYQSLTSKVFISQSGNFSSCHRMPLLKHWLHFSDQFSSLSLLQLLFSQSSSSHSSTSLLFRIHILTFLLEIRVFNEPTTEFDSDDIQQGICNIHALFLHFNFASNSKDS